MKITFLGAAGEVTGSAYYLQTGISSVLLDCGAFQGGSSADAKNGKLPSVDIKNLDAVVITHGHYDHTGRLPLLFKLGYRNPIYATEATIDLTRLILMDSVKVQESEISRINRKRVRLGLSEFEPDFDQADVDGVLSLMKAIPYDEKVSIAEGIVFRGREAGHALGSISIELTLSAFGKEKVVVFSGDLGPDALAVLKDSHPFTHADLVIMESTYGDHDHKSLPETLREGGEIIRNSLLQKGKILVPSFALGRTQQILFYLARAIDRGQLPELEVYLDSPMAIEATRIYLKYPELFDAEMNELYDSGEIKGDLSRIHTTESSEESKAINEVAGPCMIIAGSGMCNAGRILHHLKHNLSDPKTTVMFVGYQAEGSLGRKLSDGAKTVKIWGEEIEVNAQIEKMGGLSAHAGQSDLMKWFAAIAASKPGLILTHGENEARNCLSGLIEEQYGIKALLPEMGETIEI